MEGWRQGKPRLVQQSFERVKCGSIDHYHREFIPRDGKSYREICFPQEQIKTAVVQLEVVSPKVSLRWCLSVSARWCRLRQIKATKDYVVRQDEVFAEPTTLARKDIQLSRLVLIW